MKYNDYYNYLINDDYIQKTDNIHEAIYKIEGILIDGEFDYGSRGLDHNILKSDNITWTQILEYGIIIVPETNCYISNEIDQELEAAGFSRLPLDNNHIVGFKN